MSQGDMQLRGAGSILIGSKPLGYGSPTCGGLPSACCNSMCCEVSAPPLQALVRQFQRIDRIGRVLNEAEAGPGVVMDRHALNPLRGTLVGGIRHRPAPAHGE